MKVPLLDLKEQYGKIRGKVNQEIQKVLESQQFILGPVVEALEGEIAAYCEVGHELSLHS